MSENVIFRYSSHANISFRGEIDSGYSREDWAEMSEKDRDEAVVEALCELVEISADDDEWLNTYGSTE